MSSGTNNDDILMIKKHSVTIKHFNDNLFHWISIAVQVMSIKIFNRYSKKKKKKKKKKNGGSIYRFMIQQLIKKTTITGNRLTCVRKVNRFCIHYSILF